MAYTYQPKTDLRPRNLDGIGEEQIKQHWTLYEGYVKNVNELNKRISALAQKGDFGLEHAELKRRLGFEYDGMILHEHYFGVLKGGEAALAKGSELEKLMTQDFGGFDAWRQEFTAMGKMRGVGWVILYLDPQNETLSNHWVTLHQDGHPAGYTPILVMDVWEHAYMVDRGATGRADYVTAFLKNVSWSKVELRLKTAPRSSVAS